MTQELSRRDWFAGMALASYMHSAEAMHDLLVRIDQERLPDEQQRTLLEKILAGRAVRLADATIAELDKTKPKVEPVREERLAKLLQRCRDRASLIPDGPYAKGLRDSSETIGNLLAEILEPGE